MNIFNTTTDKILSSFTKTIAKLESHIESVKQDELTFDLVAQVALGAKAGATVEREKAQKALKKLQAFFE